MTEQQPLLDPYPVLGVPRDATQAHIDHAYRALVRRHHPDTRAVTDPVQAATNDAILRQVLAAYAVLGNPERRTDYDRRNPTPSPPTGPQPQPIRAHTRQAQALDQPPLRAGPVHWQPSRPGINAPAAAGAPARPRDTSRP